LPQNANAANHQSEGLASKLTSKSSSSWFPSLPSVKIPIPCCKKGKLEISQKATKETKGSLWEKKALLHLREFRGVKIITAGGLSRWRPRAQSRTGKSNFLSVYLPPAMREGNFAS